MRRGFTLVEMLVVAALIAVLIGLLLPALAAARQSARHAVCLSNQRQLIAGWMMYAAEYQERAMPLAYTDSTLIGGGDRVYWWGSDGSVSGQPDHWRGFISPYLDAGLNEHSVYECPSQPWGSYQPQGPTKSITSTYGYNGYYLSPPHTPGWSYSIGHRPWLRIGDIDQPSRLLVFADTLLPGSPPSNNALLDPPMLFSGSGWKKNFSPTTAFRHGWGRPTVAAARADGSVASEHADPDDLLYPKDRIGSVGATNDPHYVPDWREWQ